MKIKIISRGRKKNGVATAQIVVHFGSRSRTIHVWQREGKVYGDYVGNRYELPS